jgi:hypothetical protein
MSAAVIGRLIVMRSRAHSPGDDSASAELVAAVPEALARVRYVSGATIRVSSSSHAAIRPLATAEDFLVATSTR